MTLDTRSISSRIWQHIIYKNLPRLYRATSKTTASFIELNHLDLFFKARIRWRDLCAWRRSLKASNVTIDTWFPITCTAFRKTCSDGEILSDLHVLSLGECEKWFLTHRLSACLYRYAQIWLLNRQTDFTYILHWRASVGVRLIWISQPQNIIPLDRH
jgi:hypothetical protein